MATAAMKLRHLLLGRKTMTNLVTILKSRDISLPTKVQLVKAMFFSNSHVWMWELDHKKGWVPKNWCFWTVVLEKTLESPLDCKEIKPVNPKANQPWIYIGRTDVATEASILWSPDAKSHLIRKDPDSRKDWRQEEKGTQKTRRHHWLNGHEFEQALGVGEGQGSMSCCGPRGQSRAGLSDQTAAALSAPKACTSTALELIFSSTVVSSSYLQCSSLKSNEI